MVHQRKRKRTDKDCPEEMATEEITSRRQERKRERKRVATSKERKRKERKRKEKGWQRRRDSSYESAKGSIDLKPLLFNFQLSAFVFLVLFFCSLFSFFFFFFHSIRAKKQSEWLATMRGFLNLSVYLNQFHQDLPLSLFNCF
jgi:hypothetical protein